MYIIGRDTRGDFVKVIFLDVDGVINSNFYYRKVNRESERCYMFLSRELILKLKDIVMKTGAVIVLSSSWRTSFNQDMKPRSIMAEYLLTALERENLSLFDKTNVYGVDRYMEIKEWLSNHPIVETFVILDDIDFHWKELEKYWIRCDPNIGISAENIEDAVNILNS